MTKRDKTTVDDIIGIVHTDEPTDSVEEVCKLRGRTNERFKLVDDYLVEYDGDYFDLHKPSDIRSLVTVIKYVTDENEQLKKDATTLIYANQDYRQQNQNLQKQLDYIQNSITNAIKHQKTELGQKALREVIQDYNDWLLGHKEVKE